MGLHGSMDHERPKLRGFSHQVAFFFALPAGLWLASRAPTQRARTAAAAYTAGLAALFGVSATFHRVSVGWPPVYRRLLQRLDHATIFVFIACSYTPLCMLAPPSPQGYEAQLLTQVWIGACLGVAYQGLLAAAPGLQASWVLLARSISAVLYLALGWLAVLYGPVMSAALGRRNMALVVLGGILYSVGAMTYVARWPNPVPKWFGHHEVFHLFVIAAAAVHFMAVTDCVHKHEDGPLSEVPGVGRVEL